MPFARNRIPWLCYWWFFFFLFVTSMPTAYGRGRYAIFLLLFVCSHKFMIFLEFRTFFNSSYKFWLFLTYFFMKKKIYLEKKMMKYIILTFLNTDQSLCFYSNQVLIASSFLWILFCGTKLSSKIHNFQPEIFFM